MNGNFILLYYIYHLACSGCQQLMDWTSSYSLHMQDNYDITLNSITYCFGENYFIWRGITGVYELIIITLLVFLTYQNSNIPSRFREEGEVAQRVLLLTFLTTPIVVIIFFTLSQQQGIPYVEFFWIFIQALYVLQLSLILTILFIPKVRVNCAIVDSQDPTQLISHILNQ